eukprot:TRINITY_DN16808_c0_g1_i1.p1 TRINITY_DN16808_c0_g1~~TRINITY_DN16808_c0_g1_i1.p1  ORF type:complete len:398 (+),score=64.00 TRINITY_DN16808_c0_g1_i1:60-1196(+)
MNQIYGDVVHHYYWTLDWSEKTYMRLAYRGFISIAMREDGQAYLLPEIQKSYTVLDWQDLHLSGSARRKAKFYTLTVDDGLEDVLSGIDKHHESNWVEPEYKEIFRKLFSQKECKVPLYNTEATFKAHCFALKYKETGAIVAGEIGYSIGATYTSLTGFFDTEKVSPESKQLKYTSAGKVQLIALGKLLEENGYHFWNLGHPYKEGGKDVKRSMIYKKEIGGHVESRSQFLQRWKAATNAKPNSILTSNTVDAETAVKSVPIDPKLTVTELKEKGDLLLKEGKRNQAISVYTAALGKEEVKEILGNRSLTYFLNNNFSKALADAENAIELYPDWSRGYLRKANALVALDLEAEAKATCKAGLQIDPQDNALNKLFKSL